MPSQNLNRTPLYQKHLSLGAKMTNFAGWEMPLFYPTGIIKEHLAVRKDLGIFDIGHMGLIKIEGDGAFSLIQKATTNDASKLALHQCQYSIICNENGGVIDDILVYHLPMFYLIVANAVNTEKVLKWLSVLSEKSSVVIYENYCMLSVQGPRSEEVVSEILNAPLRNLKHNHTLWWKDIIISRTGYTGEDGFELIVSKKEVNKLWDSFIKEGVLPCGLGARDTLRLEAGLPLYGHEYDEETTPLEAGYDWVVKFNKGDFFGKEALLKEKAGSLKKILVGLEVDGRSIPRPGDKVLDEKETPIGKISSGTFSPILSKPIALAYLNTETEGKVFLEVRGQKIPARIIDKRFYKRIK